MALYKAIESANNGFKDRLQKLKKYIEDQERKNELSRDKLFNEDHHYFRVPYEKDDKPLAPLGNLIKDLIDPNINLVPNKMSNNNYGGRSIKTYGWIHLDETKTLHVFISQSFSDDEIAVWNSDNTLDSETTISKINDLLANSNNGNGFIKISIRIDPEERQLGAEKSALFKNRILELQTENIIDSKWINVSSPDEVDIVITENICSKLLEIENSENKDDIERFNNEHFPEFKKELIDAYNKLKFINIALNSTEEFWEASKKLLKVIFKNIYKYGPNERQLFEELSYGSKQIVLTGAPGTGKTHSVRNLVESLYAGQNEETIWTENNVFVQFHPSFDYTDFVEGLKPVKLNGKTTFVRMDGVFKQFCRNVVALNDNNPHFFVIDEINRADLSKVFGELMFALEESYRSKPVTTQYSNLPTYRSKSGDENNTAEQINEAKDVFINGFYIPENVIIIGTMNDIDRSVDTFDFALRRRFKWINIEVTNELIESTFKSMNEGKELTDAHKEAIDKIVAINSLIDEEQYGYIFHPSKSYFIGPAYFNSLFAPSNDSFEDIYIRKIEPILKEYVRGKEKIEEDELGFVEKCSDKLGISFNSSAAFEISKINSYPIWNSKLKDNYGLIQCNLITEISTGSKQIVLTGAPGTGKTHSVRNLVESLYAGQNEETIWTENNVFVQFHPSFDYTDFVEGLKPVKLNGKTTFVRMDGVFKQFCRNVVALNDNNPHFFVIDEINRADLSKVFGELMFALEESYRSKPVTTQYSNLPTYRSKSGDENNTAEQINEAKDVFINGFYIPENVIIIGTMNDIDRSVDTFDFALRRRFKWINIEVTNELIESTFKSMNEGKELTDAHKEAIDKIVAINEVINNPDYKTIFSNPKDYFIGPAHFKGLFDGESYENIYNRKIRPLLDEYVRGDEFAFDFIKECENNQKAKTKKG